MSDFSFVTLMLDLCMNAIGILVGVLLIFQARDNHLKMIWGIMMALCSLSMLWDNVCWLERFISGLGLEERSYLLIFPRMLKWYFFVHALSLFPIASLRPGWLSPLRLLVFSLPCILSSLICLCYIWFNNQITPLYTLSDVFKNMGQLDVQIRCGYFIVSVLFPSLYFLIPFMGRWITLKRRLSLGMYLYIGGMFTISIVYIFFITGTTDTIFTIYGFLVTFLPNVFAFLYLFSENPLSSRRKSLDEVPREEVADQEETVAPIVHKLYLRMTDFIHSEKPFTNPEYNIRQLANDLNTNQHLLTKTIQYGGFTGFTEYINHQRLEYFKTLATASPGASIKELMFNSGFTSRSSFYRRFSEQEKMSPKEYINQLLS